jgi:predicted dinucleotide-binding enzyme
VVVIALPWGAVETAVKAIPNWSGKIVLDATNRFGSTSPRAAVEELTGWIAGAHVVKAFNTTGYNIMANPKFGDEQASMFYAGDDAHAKAVAKSFIETLGFEAVDCGPLSNARLLESLAALWVTLARGGYGREIAFRLMRR